MNPPLPSLYTVRSFLAAALLLIPTAFLAADTAAPLPAKPPAPAQTQAAPATEPSFDLDFPGGSVPELLQAIEKASGRMPNVIRGEAADRLKIPPLKVRGITCAQLFAALQHARFGIWTPIDNGTWALTCENVILNGQMESVHVFNIQPLLAKWDVKDIVAAIQATLDMKKVDDGVTCQVRYHKETQLLIVSGTPLQIMAVEEVIHQLDPQPPVAPKPPPASPVAKAQPDSPAATP